MSELYIQITSVQYNNLDTEWDIHTNCTFGKWNQHNTTKV